MAPIAQRQFQATLAPGAGFAGLNLAQTKFNNVSGAALSADVTKVWNGGETTPFLLSGPSEFENITVSKPFDPDTDWDNVVALRGYVGELTGILTVTTSDRDLDITTGRPRKLSVLLVNLTEPDWDSTSSDAATWSLEFAVASVAP